MTNLVLQLRRNPTHHSSLPSELLSLNQYEIPFRPKQLLHKHRLPILYHNLFKLQNLLLEAVIELVYRVFTTFYKQESIVVVATLASNTIGGFVQFVGHSSNQIRISPSFSNSTSPILTVGSLITPVTWIPQFEFPPKLELSPKAK